MRDVTHDVAHDVTLEFDHIPHQKGSKIAKSGPILMI